MDRRYEMGQDTARAEERERFDALAALTAMIISRFHQTGHPGYPALRSGWEHAETVESWREQLRLLLEGQPPGNPERLAWRAVDAIGYLSAAWHHRLSTDELAACRMVIDALAREANSEAAPR